MPISVACQCGRRFSAKEELAGKKVACPACKRPLLIPMPGAAQSNPVRRSTPKAAPVPAAAPSSAAANSVAVACRCGQKFKAASHLFGKTVSCPKCRSPLTVPDPDAPVLAEPIDDPLMAGFGGANAGNDPLGIGSLNTFPQSGPAANDPLGIGAFNTLPQTMPSAGMTYGNYGSLTTPSPVAAAPASAPAKKKSSGKGGKFWTFTGSGIGTAVIVMLVLLRIGGTVAKAMRRAGVFNGPVKAEWVPHTSQSGGYSVEIVKQKPGVTIPGLAGNIGSNGVVTTMSEAGPCTVVNAEQLPGPVPSDQIELALTAWQTEMQGMITSSGGELVESGACTVAGLPGRELIIEVEEDGTVSVVHFRASFHGNWAYTLAYLATDPVYDEDEADHFFNSFRLLNNSAPNATAPLGASAAPP